MLSAHEMYEALFGELNGIDDAEELTVIPDNVLTIVPYAALAIDIKSVDKVDWLGRHFALTVMPSLRSLVAIRKSEAVDSAQPFIGFADPAVDGAGQVCGSYSAWGRPSNARLCPLDETIDHVHAIALALGVDPNTTLFLGPGATRENIELQLEQPVHVVAFATHGLNAEESYKLFGVREPALLLSPTKAGKNDELLTASEIESMSIDADLVILSACNTAMGGDNSEEPLSGFARAFFEAGARGVMVSNWYINPTSTGELLLAFAKEIMRDPRQPFSFALQAAMISQSKRNSDPRDWAIFTYIGK